MYAESHVNPLKAIWLGIRILVPIMSVVGFFYLVHEHREENRLSIYENIDAIIVSINANTEGFSQDKFHTPMLCNKVLFKKIDEPLYVSHTTCNNYSGDDILLNDQWIYNHRVGDTVHFDAIKKHRFFKIADKYVPQVK